MLFIAENLKALRKKKDMTQEDAAELLNVSPQSVSKWERGDTLPDITMLPALANLYQTSVDALLGMDKINDAQARKAVFTAAHTHWRNGDASAAAAVYAEALKTFPNDEGIMSDLAMALALAGETAQLAKAIELCERVLAAGPSEKVRHTTRAALCFMHLKNGDKGKAVAAAQSLPHIRESRESVLAEFAKDPSTQDIDDYLQFIALGEDDAQDVITIDFGVNMVAVATDHGLVSEIQAIRAQNGKGRLPMVRVRRYADYLLDCEFDEPSDAACEVTDVLWHVVNG